LKNEVPVGYVKQRGKSIGLERWIRSLVRNQPDKERTKNNDKQKRWKKSPSTPRPEAPEAHRLGMVDLSEEQGGN